MYMSSLSATYGGAKRSRETAHLDCDMMDKVARISSSVSRGCVCSGHYEEVASTILKLTGARWTRRRLLV